MIAGAFLYLAGNLLAGCLVIDSLTYQAAPCASGTCATGPGVIGQAETMALLVPQFLVIGHNSCKTKQPVLAQKDQPFASWIVEIAFYDKDDYRIGIGQLYVGSLEPGEKFKRLYQVPDNIRPNGPVATIKVRFITQTVKIPGGE